MKIEMLEKKKKNVRESQASKRWLKWKTAGFDTWTLVRNGINQDSVNVIMQSLIHIWKIIKKISLPLGRKPADWDFANVYFRAIRGDFWTTKSKNKQTNKWMHQKERKDRNQAFNQERSQIYSEMGLKCDKLSKPYWEN